MGVCIWLAKFLRMSRPEQSTRNAELLEVPGHRYPSLTPTSRGSCASTRSQLPATSKISKKSSSSSSKKKNDLFQRQSSRSLLANVLDLEDNFLLLNLTAAERQTRPYIQVPTSIELSSLSTTPLSPTSPHGNADCGAGLGGLCSPRPMSSHGVGTIQRDRLNGTPGYLSISDRPTAWPADDCSSELECALLTDVLGEVRYLTGRLRQDVSTQKVCSEWKFAAMVVDRLCLWLFSIFTIVSTGTILLSTPDIANIF